MFILGYLIGIIKAVIHESGDERSLSNYIRKGKRDALKKKKVSAKQFLNVIRSPYKNRDIPQVKSSVIDVIVI